MPKNLNQIGTTWPAAKDTATPNALRLYFGLASISTMAAAPHGHDTVQAPGYRDRETVTIEATLALGDESSLAP